MTLGISSHERGVTPLVPEASSLLDRVLAAALAQRPLADSDALALLSPSEVPLLALLQAAFVVRERHFGRRVRIHVLNTAQNGSCPEDCSYCAQAKNSQAPIERYRLKDDDQILAEAGSAHAAGAYRYCVVLSGRGPSARRVEWLAQHHAHIGLARDERTRLLPGVSGMVTISVIRRNYPTTRGTRAT